MLIESTSTTFDRPVPVTALTDELADSEIFEIQVLDTEDSKLLELLTVRVSVINHETIKSVAELEGSMLLEVTIEILLSGEKETLLEIFEELILDVAVESLVVTEGMLVSDSKILLIIVELDGGEPTVV